MLVALVVVQWAHIVLGMLWAGGAVVLEVIVTPATAALPLPERRLLGQRLASRVGPFFAAVGAGTMLLGIVRGTVLGPLRGLGAFGSAYGVTWLLALAVTIGLAVLGGAVLGPAFDRLYRDDALWRPSSEVCAGPELARALRRLGRLGSLQLVGFAVVVACMVLMAVGL